MEPRQRYLFILLIPLLLSVAQGTSTFIQGFIFAPIAVAPSTSTINQVTSYSFFIDRSTGSDGLPTAYSTPVPISSNITLKFPSIYNTSYGYTCTVDSVTYSCTSVGQNVVITGYFTTAIAVTTLTVVVSNVLNPTPAMETGEFVVTIGIDTSDTSSSNLAGVQLQSDNFTTCSINFSPNTVNKSGVAMQVYATPRNAIPSTGYIVVTFPSLGYWLNDIASQAFPVSSSMTCANATTV